ncbi:DUF3617 domain-containing protein [Altererythrobacter sp. MF3-039]|uniref:DUF3617 domain-containing protein n=1 Tax=Altererythrobacter sp. MF3-039 TaxID=3252901 RepID=UPI00390CCA2E
MALVPVMAAALGACGSDPVDTNADGEISVAEAAARAEASGMKPLAGEYKVTVEVLEVNIPGAPADMADMMRNAMGSSSHTYCMTQEEVDKGFEEMARQSQEGQDCSFERFEVDGGEIDGKMICNVDGQGSMTMTMKGTGGETRSEMDMTMQGNVAGMGDMTMRMKTTHERQGDCA